MIFKAKASLLAISFVSGSPSIDVFELDGVTYFALLEILPEGQETDEVLIMQVEGDIESEEAELVMVEDEETLQKAFDEFCRRDEEREEEN